MFMTHGMISDHSATTTSGISLVGTSTGGGTTALPSYLEEGDYVIVHTAADNYDPNGVSGWTTLQTRLSSARGFLAAKFMGTSPETEIILDSRLSVCVIAFRGVDPGQPQDVANASSFSGSGATPNAPSITSITNGCAIVVSASLDDKIEGGDVTAPLGFQDVISSSDGSEAATAMMAWAPQDFAAPINPAAFGSGSDEYWAVTQAIRPVI